MELPQQFGNLPDYLPAFCITSIELGFVGMWVPDQLLGVMHVFPHVDHGEWIETRGIGWLTGHEMAADREQSSCRRIKTLSVFSMAIYVGQTSCTVADRLENSTTKRSP